MAISFELAKALGIPIPPKKLSGAQKPREDSQRTKAKQTAARKGYQNGYKLTAVEQRTRLFEQVCLAHHLPAADLEVWFAPWQGGRALKTADGMRACGHPAAADKAKCPDCGAARRKWRFDYVWEGWLALEVQGGLHTGGRHTRGAALELEYEKLNEAAVQGYTLLFCTPEQLDAGSIFPLVRRLLGVGPQ